MSLIDIYDTWRKRRNYQKAVEASKLGFAWIHQNIESSNMEVSQKHFGHDERLADYKKVIKTWQKKTDKTINFGDSIADFARDQFAVNHDGIFSIGGSWAHHMQQMAEALADDLKDFRIKNITIGTLGGNPMLVYRNMDEVINAAITCLNRVRQLYPNSRIIVYGIPPLFNIYATMNCTDFDMKMIEWVTHDPNARFLSLKQHFGTGFAKFFPSSKWSADGVHFTEAGAAKLNKLLHDQMQ